MRSALTRHLILPIVFGLRGEHVRREFARLRALEFASKDALAAVQFQKLLALTRFAESRCPFYRKRFADFGVTSHNLGTLDDLRHFPTVSKANLPELLVQTRDLRRGMRSLQVRKTAGSSGNPSVVIADGRTNANSLAARYRSYSWYGIQPGDKEVRFWGRPLREGRWKQRVKNEVLNRFVVDSALLNTEAIGATVQRIVEAGGAYAYGYSSMVLSFVENIEKREELQNRLHFKAAVCTSETITDFERARISAALNCPVPREYGCSETDIIAFDCPDGALHVIDENVLLEIEPSGNAGDGCGEIIVTDLNNFAMPLIRYRIGDLGSFGASGCSCGRNSKVLTRLLGRQMGQYIRLSGGRLIHSQVIAYAFEDIVADGYPIRRFRVIQLDEKNVLIKIVSSEGKSEQLPEVATVVANKLQRTLDDASLKFKFEFVEEMEFRAIDRKFSHFESRIS